MLVEEGISSSIAVGIAFLMTPRVCRCCGELFSPENLLSRNPNICASCSSMLDGMDLPEDAAPEMERHLSQAPVESPASEPVLAAKQS